MHFSEVNLLQKKRTKKGHNLKIYIRREKMDKKNWERKIKGNGEKEREGKGRKKGRERKRRKDPPNMFRYKL